MITVQSYGGGVNSLALLLRAVAEGIAPDLVVFADTDAEFPHTYESIREVKAWLARTSPQSEWIDVKWIRRDGSFVSIEQMSLARKELPSKAYGMSGCTTKWKQQPIDRAVYNHPRVKAELDREGGIVRRWIGYDADEPHRLARMQEKNPQPKRKILGKVQWEAPLIQWDMGREDCDELIHQSELTHPGKSSCFSAHRCASPRSSRMRGAIPS